MAARKIAKNIKFEEALQELEEQVRLLESGELSLEQSLEAFKYGVGLSKLCMDRLHSARQEVETFVADVNGQGYQLEPFSEMEA